MLIFAENNKMIRLYCNYVEKVTERSAACGCFAARLQKNKREQTNKDF